jgi:hypothetical protein
MKKFIIPLAVALAVAIVPASALADPTHPQDWAGWQNQHSDNLASPNYPLTFGNNGKGNSQYCVDPSVLLPNPATASTHCGASVQNGGTAVYSPVVFSGVLLGPAPQGCSHQDAGATPDNNVVKSPNGNGPSNPCASTDTAGAVYLGCAGNNTDPAGSASQPVPPNPVCGPGQGLVGLQG